MAKIHRFIDNFDLSQNNLEIKGEIARQIDKVLRLEIGEKIELCDGRHISAMAYICQIDKNKVQVKIEKILEKKEIEKKVTLFCSVLKKENFEMVVQKTTECGVSKIIPIISARTVKTGLNIERLQKIAKEASEQSGRVNVPEISEPISFEKSLELIKKEDLNIFFDTTGDLLFEKHGYFSAEKFLVLAPSRSQVISNSSSPSINLFIGPEGGWTPEEIEKAKNSDFKILSLGSLTLRAETAAIVATFLVSNL